LGAPDTAFSVADRVRAPAPSGRVAGFAARRPAVWQDNALDTVSQSYAPSCAQVGGHQSEKQFRDIS